MIERNKPPEIPELDPEQPEIRVGSRVCLENEYSAIPLRPVKLDVNARYKVVRIDENPGGTAVCWITKEEMTEAEQREFNNSRMSASEAIETIRDLAETGREPEKPDERFAHVIPVTRKGLVLVPDA